MLAVQEEERSDVVCGSGEMAMSCKDGKPGLDNGKYVRYTPEQVEALERLYHDCPKPSSIRRQQLIRECPILCNIEPKQIKVWFQNRRYALFHFIIRFFEIMILFACFFVGYLLCFGSRYIVFYFIKRYASV